ncbi:MAG: glycosyl transferase family 28 [Chitinophagaceae bacterium]|nr:glycosyl transferase family 28 [Chitinophagaceae bacterium]
MSEAPKFNKRILVAPLDWGLGHATRCIPVIRNLRALGCDTWIATSGAQEKLLRMEFPDVPFLNLPGYGVSYGKRGVMLRLLRQIPVIRRHIFTEHAWLQNTIRDYGFHGVISDNRYGLYSEQVPCVLITHQLSLQLPRWAAIFGNGVQQMLYHHIEHFGECWIPDTGYEPSSLAGAMSHPVTLPDVPVKYIGWLSRFQPGSEMVEERQGILISISGPEPQRSVFEEKILEQIHEVKEDIRLIRGMPGTSTLLEVPGHVTVYNHMDAHDMQKLMKRCRLLISRSGYSTVMDAMILGTPLACIPTPGQTEQEYLSKRLMEKEWAVCDTQDNFSLKKLIEKAEGIKGVQASHLYRSDLKDVLCDWLQKL